MSAITLNTVRKQEEFGHEELLGPLPLSIDCVLADFSGEFRSADPSLAALGVVTCFRMAKGASLISNSRREASLSKRMGDAWGRTQSYLKCLKGGFIALSGAVFTAARGLTIASWYTTSKAIAVAAAVLGRAIGAVFSVTSLVSIVILSRSVHKLRTFRNELTEKGFSYLIKQNPVVLKRMTSAECVKAIKKATPEKAKAIVEMALAHNQKNLKRDAIYLGLEVVAMSAGVLLSAFVGGIPLLVASGMLALVSLSWILLDSKEMLDAFKSGESGRYDMLMIIASTIACSVAVVAGFFMAANPLSLALAGAFGLIVLACNGVAYSRLTQNQGSLTYLFHRIKAGDAKGAKKSYKRLSVKDQRRIQRLVWRKIHNNRSSPEKIAHAHCLANPLDPALLWAVATAAGEKR